MFVRIYNSTGFGASCGPLPGTHMASNLAAGSPSVSVGDGWWPRVAMSFEIEDLLDPYRITYVALPVPASSLIHADYMTVAKDSESTVEYFYAIVDVLPTSSDVSQVFVTLDPFMTGGQTKVAKDQFSYQVKANYGDERVFVPAGHVSRTNALEVMKQPITVDPFYGPAKQPVFWSGVLAACYPTGRSNLVPMVGATIDPSKIDDTTIVSKIKQTVNLTSGGNISGTTEQEVTPSDAPIYTTSDFTTVEVEVPAVADVGGIPGLAQSLNADTRGYGLYNLLSPKVKAGLNAMRGVGMESAVTCAYRIDTSLVRLTASSDAVKIKGISARSAYQYLDAHPKDIYPDSIPWRDLAYCCPAYTIGISSMLSGDYFEDAAVNCGDYVYTVIDPRPTGRPYFFLPPRNQRTGQQIDAVLSYIQGRCAKGLTWEQVPIVWDRASGSSFSAFSYEKSAKRTADDLSAYEASRGRQQVKRLLSAGAQSGSTITAGLGIGPMIGEAIDVGTERYYDDYGSRGMTEVQAQYESPLAKARLQAARETIDLAEAYVKSTQYYPTAVSFSPAEGFQQLAPNGVMAIVKYPDPDDVVRFGTIFAIFGRACSIDISINIEGQGVVDNPTHPYLTMAPNARSIYIQEQTGACGGYIERMRQDRLSVGYRFCKEVAFRERYALDPATYWPGGD